MSNPYRDADVPVTYEEEPDTALKIITETSQRIEMHGEEVVIIRTVAAYFGYRLVEEDQ